MNTQTVTLWDPLVRLFHWSLVIIIFSNLFFNEEGDDWHQWLGYTACGLVLFRFIWGFVGKGAARWSDFFPTPKRLGQHFKALFSGQPYHRMGHSPIGALVMILMMLCVLGLTTTGWMYLESDLFYEEDWVEECHEALTIILQLLIVLHISAAIFESWRMKENLPLSMITGKRRQRDDLEN